MFNSAETPLSRSRGGAWILVALAFLIPIAWPAVRKLQIDQSPARELEANSPSLTALREIQSRFPAGESILVGWDNANLLDVRVPLLQQRLLGAVGEDGIRRGGSPYVETVSTPLDEMKRMTDRGIAPETAYAQLTGTLIGRGRLHVTLSDQARSIQEQTIPQLVGAVREKAGIALRVAPRTIAFFPEDEDKLFEGITIDLPKEISKLSGISDGHDIELAWDGMHAPASQRQVLEILQSVVGYATAAFPNGVPLVKTAEFHAGLPLAMEIRLSSAGRIDGRRAVSEIRRIAAECRVPTDQLLLAGDLVDRASLDQGLISATSIPFGRTAPLGGLAGVIVLAGLALGLRSPGRAMLVFGLTVGLALFVLGGFALAGIPMTLLAAVGVLLGSLPTLALLSGMTSSHSPAADRSYAARLASLVTILAGGAMAAAPSIPLRTVGISIAAMALLTLAVVESPIAGWLLRKSAAPLTSLENDFSLLVGGPGRWIGLSLLLPMLGAAGGLAYLKFNPALAAPLRMSADYASRIERTNDTLAGAASLETIVRFAPQAQSRMRFAERLELVRSIEADVRNVPGVTGALSLAAYQPVRTAPASDASTRERATFNRMSRSLEDELRSSTAPESALVAFGSGAATKAQGAVAGAGTTELWKIRLHVDATADVESLAKQLGAVIPQRTRLEPGVDHIVAGMPIVRGASLRSAQLSVILMIAASFVVTAGVCAALLTDLPAGLAVVFPSFLMQAGIVGMLAWNGFVIDPLSAAVAVGLAVLGTSIALRITASAHRRILGGRDAASALTASLAESANGIPLAAVAGSAVVVGLLNSTFIGETAFLIAAGVAGSLVSTFVVVPTLLIGRLQRLAALQCEQTNSVGTGPVEAAHPLRRSA